MHFNKRWTRKNNIFKININFYHEPLKRFKSKPINLIKNQGFLRIWIFNWQIMMDFWYNLSCISLYELIMIFFKLSVTIFRYFVVFLSNLKNIKFRTVKIVVLFFYEKCHTGAIRIELVCHWWHSRLTTQKQHIFLFWHTKN